MCFVRVVSVVVFVSICICLAHITGRKNPGVETGRLSDILFIFKFLIFRVVNHFCIILQTREIVVLNFRAVTSYPLDQNWVQSGPLKTMFAYKSME